MNPKLRNSLIGGGSLFLGLAYIPMGYLGYYLGSANKN